MILNSMQLLLQIVAVAVVVVAVTGRESLDDALDSADS